MSVLREKAPSAVCTSRAATSPGGESPRPTFRDVGLSDRPAGVRPIDLLQRFLLRFLDLLGHWGVKMVISFTLFLFSLSKQYDFT